MTELKRTETYTLVGTSNLQHIINVARNNEAEVMKWDDEIDAFTQVRYLVDIAFTGMYSDKLCDVKYYEDINVYYIRNIRSL